MERIDWSPKGGDGASTDQPDGTESKDDYPTDAQIDDAVSVFVTISRAIAHGETQLARVTWEGFTYRIGRFFNPVAMFVQAGIITTARAVRASAGDPEPDGPPTGEYSLTMLACDAETGELLDREEITIAEALIAHGCNWDWEKINQELNAHVEGKPSDNEFFLTIAAVLIAVFIGVGGLESESTNRTS